MPEDSDVEHAFVDLGDAEAVPIKWVIEDLLPTGLTFIGAPAKSKKSTLEMIMSCLVAGLPCRALPAFLSRVPETGRVVGWSYEATAGELRHMCEVGLLTRIPNDKSILIADDPWLFRLDDPDGQSRLLNWLDALRPKLAWLDPLRDMHSLEEKDSGAMNRLLRPVQRWAKENDACVLIVHHTKKREEGEYTANDLRGTTALFGIADGVLMLTPKQGGMLQIKAIFKRAEGWDRLIKIAAYEFAGETAWEQMGDVEKQVLNLIKGGAPTLDAVASQLKLGKARVLKATETLIHNSLLIRDGRKLRAVDAIKGSKG